MNTGPSSSRGFNLENYENKIETTVAVYVPNDRQIGIWMELHNWTTLLWEGKQLPFRQCNFALVIQDLALLFQKEYIPPLLKRGIFMTSHISGITATFMKTHFSQLTLFIRIFNSSTHTFHIHGIWKGWGFSHRITLLFSFHFIFIIHEFLCLSNNFHSFLKHFSSMVFHIEIEGFPGRYCNDYYNDKVDSSTMHL